MTIEAGTRVPQATFHMKTAEGVKSVDSTAYFADGRTVLFAVPGAFTSTCSAKHLPGFVRHAGELKGKGVQRIACLSVNDVHVMTAWAEAGGAAGIVDMMADPHAHFAEALGIAVDFGEFMGVRATRCAMIVEDGVVAKVFMETPGAYEVSSASHVMSNL